MATAINAQGQGSARRAGQRKRRILHHGGGKTLSVAAGVATEIQLADGGAAGYQTAVDHGRRHLKALVRQRRCLKSHHTGKKQPQTTAPRRPLSYSLSPLSLTQNLVGDLDVYHIRIGPGGNNGAVPTAGNAVINRINFPVDRIRGRSGG